MSFGEGYSSPCPRVNLCLASSRKSAADSILDGKGDTHEIQFISSKSSYCSRWSRWPCRFSQSRSARPSTLTSPLQWVRRSWKRESIVLLIDGNKATVQKGKQVVAQSDGRWEDRDTKSNYDAVLLNDAGQVSEVRFAGQKKVFVFSE